LIVARPLSVVADQAFSRAAGAPLIDGNTVRLLRDARENYPAWMDAIRKARKWIHFESYIVHNDTSGQTFADALIDRARAGVRVRLIYDWIGALTATTWIFWERLRRAGVEVRAFNQPRLDSPLGWLSRDHRKMIAVDGEVGFISGLCVGDVWAGIGRYARRGPWRDTGVEIRGSAVADIEKAFADIWSTMGAALPSDEAIIVPGSAESTVALRVIATKPATAGMFRLDQLVAAVARKTLWLTDAYFVGASPYVQALVAAAEDGVDVRLLVPGGSDLPWVQRLTRAGYRPLLDAGVRIFEWNGSMVHAKTAVADRRWARVGSSNLNIQSWLGNWELDVAIEDEDFARQTEDMYLEDLENATEIVLTRNRVGRARAAVRARHARRGWAHRTGRRAATAGALRLGRTFSAALTARRELGGTEAATLLYGLVLLGALGAAALAWPTVIAYPLGVFLVWVAFSWGIQSLKLWRQRRRETPIGVKARPGRREDAA
jgi:cardiolipin synthase A/B